MFLRWKGVCSMFEPFIALDVDFACITLPTTEIFFPDVWVVSLSLFLSLPSFSSLSFSHFLLITFFLIILSFIYLSLSLLHSQYQCFSTGGTWPSGGPQRSVSGPPNLSHFVSNYNSIHNYYKFYKKSNFLTIQASRKDKISQF